MGNYVNHKNVMGAIALQNSGVAGYQSGVVVVNPASCFQAGTVNITPTVNEEAHPDHTGRMVNKGSTNHAKSVEWEVTLPIEPAGTSGGSATYAPLMQVGMLKAPATGFSATTSCGSAGSVTEVHAAIIKNLSAGMVVPIETVSGSDKFRMRQIVSVTSTGPDGSFTVTPALETAPVSGCRILKSHTMAPQNDDTNTSFTVHALTKKTTQKCTGGFPTGITVNWGGNARPNISFTGPGRTYGQVWETTLISALPMVSAASAGSATIAIAGYDSEASGMMVKIGTEVVALGSATSNLFAIAASARGLNGSTEASAASGATVSAYWPVATSAQLYGSPVPSPKVFVFFGGRVAGTVSAIGQTDGSFSLDGGLVAEENEFGSDWLNECYSHQDGELAPTIEVTGRLRPDDLQAFQLNQKDTERAALVQFGETIGNMFAVSLPYTIFKTAQPTGFGDGQGSIGVTRTREARGKRTGLDAFYLAEG